MIYYTGSLHLDADPRLLSLVDKRSFMTTGEQFDYIKARWNAKIMGDDDIYLLGDTVGAFTKSRFQTEVILGRMRELKGHKHIITGVCDAFLLSAYKKWFYIYAFEDNDDARKEKVCDSIDKMLTIEDSGHKVNLGYHPYQFGLSNNNRDSDVYIFGCRHVGDSFSHSPNVLSAFCGFWDYTPVTLKELQFERSKTLGMR